MFDDDYDYDTDLEDEEQRPQLPPRKKPKTVLSRSALMKRLSKPAPVCASLVLDSALKFNTALALAGDGPVLINNHDCCLNCCLRLAVELKDMDRDNEIKDVSNPSSRWVICKKRGMVERLPLPVLNSRAMKR